MLDDDYDTPAYRALRDRQRAAWPQSAPSSIRAWLRGLLGGNDHAACDARLNDAVKRCCELRDLFEQTQLRAKQLAEQNANMAGEWGKDCNRILDLKAEVARLRALLDPPDAYCTPDRNGFIQCTHCRLASTGGEVGK